MGKASASKKVARAARTGGGRTKRGSSSFVFPLAIGVVVVLGSLLIWSSRNGLSADVTPPAANKDHWHAAIGFDICGTFAPPIQSNEDPVGIHTHGDGVIHIHPFVSRAAGNKAKLNVFLKTVGAKVSTTEIKLPGGADKKKGQECEGRPAKVQVKVWNSRGPEDHGRLWTLDPGDIRLANNQLITVAFVPDGVDIPKPPSEGALDRLTDVGASTTIPETTATTTATTTPGTTATTGSPGTTAP